MQTYLGLKPKRNPASAPTSVPGSAAIPAPAAEDAVSRAIELLHEEFFSTGTQLKHVFTAAQVYSPLSLSLAAVARLGSYPHLVAADGLKFRPRLLLDTGD